MALAAAILATPLAPSEFGVCNRADRFLECHTSGGYVYKLRIPAGSYYIQGPATAAGVGDDGAWHEVLGNNCFLICRPPKGDLPRLPH